MRQKSPSHGIDWLRTQATRTVVVRWTAFWRINIRLPPQTLRHPQLAARPGFRNRRPQHAQNRRPGGLDRDQYPRVGDLYQLYLVCQRDHIDYHVTYIPETFNEKIREPFDRS